MGDQRFTSKNSFAIETTTGISSSNLPKCFNPVEVELMSSSASDYLLTFGDFQREPFPSLKSIPGFAGIKKNLHEELGVETGNVLQLNAARYILAGRNCFLIGAAHSKGGKSLSYMIPLITRLRENYEGYAKLEGNGPLALIVCATNASGLKLEETLMNLTEGSKVRYEFVQDIEIYDPELEYERRRKGFLKSAIESPDIIVATTEVAAALVKDTKSSFSFDRLSFLIFDDAHVVLKFRQEELKTILRGFKTYADKLKYRKCTHQTIFCGSQWTPELQLYSSELTDIPILLIASAIQALKYSQMPISVVPTNEDRQFEDLKDILQRHKSVRRIIVAVQDWKTVKSLRIKATEQQLKNLHFLEGKGFVGAHMETAKRIWDSETPQVIICTSDTNIRELQVSNASLLIHYDIPEDDLRTFAVRFSSVWRKGKNLKRVKGKSVKQYPMSCVMLSADLPNANVILWKLHTLGATIPSDLLEIARQDKLSRMKKVSLCRGFICMGDCLQLNQSECSHRHYFVEDDFNQISVLPKTGQVELFVTEALAPNLYMAKILRYCDRDPVTNKVIKFQDFMKEALNRHLRLKELVDQDQRPESFHPGTKVVIALRDKQEYRYMYTRGEIIEVATRTYAGLPKAVRINCMDVGEIKLILVDDILTLPQEMEDLPACSVQVVLANTAPPYGEKSFRLAHISKTKDYYKLNPILQADISLSIGNTIWVRRLVKLKKLDIGRIVETWDATYELSKKKILVRNPGHLELMYKACEDHGFSCDVYRRTKVPSWFHDSQFQNEYAQTSDLCRYAYLPVYNLCGAEIVSSTVAAKYISTDNKIFVSLVKFEDMLEKLEEEIHKTVFALKQTCDWNKEVEFHRYYEVGLVVAALDSQDGRYRRGIITQVEQTDGKHDVEYSFRVFLVDIGEESVFTMVNIFPIPKRFVSCLPFQAIHLTLDHVKSKRPKSSEHRISHRTIDFLMPDSKAIDIEVVAIRNFRIDGDVVEYNSYEAFIFGGQDEISEFYIRENVADFTPDGEMNMKKIKNELLEKFQKDVAEFFPTDELDDDEDNDFDVNSGVANEDENSESDFDVNFEALSAQDMLTTLYPDDNFQASEPKSEPKSASIPASQIQKGGKTEEAPLKKEPAPASETVSADVLKKATVSWYQNDRIVLIRVHIPDIVKCDCELVGKNVLQFSSFDPPDYGFSLILSKRVEPNVTVRLFGQYCEIKLVKRMLGLKWNVLSATQGLHWIQPELNMEDDEDVPESKPRKMFQYQDVDYEEMVDAEYHSDDEVYELEDKMENLLE